MAVVLYQSGYRGNRVMHYASTNYGDGLCDIGGLILGSIPFYVEHIYWPIELRFPSHLRIKWQVLTGTCSRQEVSRNTSGEFVWYTWIFGHIFCESLFPDTSQPGKSTCPLSYVPCGIFRWNGWLFPMVYKILGADLRLECARVRYYDAVVMSKEYPITGIHKICGKKIHEHRSGHTNLHPWYRTRPTYYPSTGYQFRNSVSTATPNLFADSESEKRPNFWECSWFVSWMS